MTLGSRLALVTAATVLLASVLGGIGIGLSWVGTINETVDAQLERDVARIVNPQDRLRGRIARLIASRQNACESSLQELESGPAARRPRPSQIDSPFTASLQVLSPSGETTSACRVLPVDSEDLAVAARGRGSRVRTVEIGGEGFRVITAGIGRVGAIQVSRNIELAERTIAGLAIRVAGFGFLGSLIAGLAGWRFARRTVKPLERLDQATRQVARTGDLGEQVAVEGPAEIAAMATSFNTMLETLDTSRTQQRRLVQDASHELRTPLTSIRTNVELLRRHSVEDPQERQEVLDDIITEVGELSGLVSELVELATEVGVDRLQHEPVDLDLIVLRCVDRCRRRHRRTIDFAENSSSQDQLSPQPIESGGVVGDPEMLARAVTNLITNAVKFSDASTPVLVATTPNSVRVLDRGPGVAAEELPRIFDRFYRTDDARWAPGSGLGLAIVSQIVEHHGGTVFAANRPGGGLEIGFDLPDGRAPRT